MFVETDHVATAKLAKRTFDMAMAEGNQERAKQAFDLAQETANDAITPDDARETRQIAEEIEHAFAQREIN